MNKWMEGWMDGWMAEWVDGQRDESIANIRISVFSRWLG